MLPGGNLYGIYWLIVSSYFLGWSLAYIPSLNIPPVFGMLLSGILFRANNFNIHDDISSDIIGKIRTFCVSFVMLRAGLQLTTTAIKNNPLFLIKLALIPCTFEFLTIAFVSRFILDYPWSWAFLNGTIVACMSPVVTVNCILALAEKGYGEDKEIATLLCTATSIDDVHIISLFSVCYSFVFKEDKNNAGWWTYIPGGYRDLILGLLIGLCFGLLYTFVPHRNANYVFWYRLFFIVITSIMFTTAASTIAITGGGYLAVVVMSFVSATGWRLLSGITFDITPLRIAVYYLWHFIQPVLVGIIGAEIDLQLWSPKRFCLHVLCILLGLFARSVFAVLSTFGMTFNMKERIFVALAWLPKGTLQAALAPMALQHARETGDENDISLAIDIVRISVISIILLAPLGAILMMIFGPILLNKIDESEITQRRHLSILRWTSLQPVRRDSTKDLIRE
ncbi:sodium/hydrogen exchanger 9B2-like [Aphidius gifuensis]|nr:sodium/hydrogen exchanger 9B2-like [Aphidius gifuensis]